MAFRRAARWTAASTLGVGALAGAQAFACHAWYEALPDATGPTSGVAIPRTVVHDVAGTVPACLAAAICHAREDKQLHETGPIDVDTLDAWWATATKHGFRLAPGAF